MCAMAFGAGVAGECGNLCRCLIYFRVGCRFGIFKHHFYAIFTILISEVDMVGVNSRVEYSKHYPFTVIRLVNIFAYPYVRDVGKCHGIVVCTLYQGGELGSADTV